LKASFHDSQILIRESHIDYELRFMTVHQLYKLLHRVRVDLVGHDVFSTDFLSETVTLLFGARSDDDFGEYLRILCAFVGYDCAYPTGADNKYLSHFLRFDFNNLTF
jgi:hypothetical protein